MSAERALQLGNGLERVPRLVLSLPRVIRCPSPRPPTAAPAGQGVSDDQAIRVPTQLAGITRWLASSCWLAGDAGQLGGDTNRLVIGHPLAGITRWLASSCWLAA
ncbi:hypothetical protein GCM10009714_22870 [Microlunatus capsulatus]